MASSFSISSTRRKQRLNWGTTTTGRQRCWSGGGKRGPAPRHLRQGKLSVLCGIVAYYKEDELAEERIVGLLQAQDGRCIGRMVFPSFQ